MQKNRDVLDPLDYGLTRLWTKPHEEGSLHKDGTIKEGSTLWYFTNGTTFRTDQ